MKRLILFAFLIVLIIGTAQQVEADAFGKIAHQMLSKLHTVSGDVIKVDAGRIELNKGEKDGLIRNSFVYIYRNVGSFIPLNSNVPIKLREGIAYADVIKVFPNRAIAVISQGVEKEKKYFMGLGIIPNGEREVIGKPEVGDKFIAGKPSYTVAIVTRNPYVYSSLKTKLESTGKFFVIGEDRVQIAIVNNHINSLYGGRVLKKLAAALDADLVINVSLVKLSDIRYTLYDGYSGRPILRGVIPISRKLRVVLSSQPFNQIPPQNLVASNLRLRPKLTFWESLLGKFGLYSPYTGLSMSSSAYRVVFYKPIGYGTTAFYFGKLNKNISNVVAIAQGSTVKVYKVGWSSLRRLFEFRYGYNIVNIDTARIDGRIMVAISNFNRFGYLSSAIGYIKDDKFIPIKDDLPYHVRFYNKFSKNPILIAQKASISKPFYGPIYKINLSTFGVSRLDLPIKPKSFYEFFKVGDDIVFLNKLNQLEVYNVAMNRVVQTIPYIFGGGERLIQRYPVNLGNAQESVQELYKKASVVIPKDIEVQKLGNKLYLLGLRNYVSNHITIARSSYNAYNLKLFEFVNGKWKFVWSSGDVKGRIVACAKDGSYIISVVGVPAGFLDRFVRGIDEIDRLTVARIEY